MRYAAGFGTMAFLLLIALGLGSVAAQEKFYKAKVIDNQNNQYSLSNVAISGTTVFHCRLKDTVFTLDFSKVRSLAINPQAASPFQGYMPANFTLADGGSAQAYVDLDNFWLEGTEDNFQVRIQIKLSEVVRLDLTEEVIPPSPSPSPSPSPAPSPSAQPPTPDFTSPPSAPSLSPSYPL
jgi:hypothetical protein